MKRQQDCWRSLSSELAEAGIRVMEPATLTPDDRRWLEDYFLPHVFPVLTPLAIDPAHPFPSIPNLGFAMVMQMRRVRDARSLTALLPLPSTVEPLVRPPGPTGKQEGRERG